MQADNDGLNVFFILNRLFQWSENFITRELTELNQLGVEMTIGSRDVLRRDDLKAQERQLLEKHVPIQENPFCLEYFARHAEIAVSRPSAYLSTWRTLFSLKHKPSKFLRGIVCLFRAAGIAKQVEQRGTNLIHAHFLTAQTETALYLSKLTGIPFGATAYAQDIYVDNSGNAAKLKHASYINATTQYNQNYLAQLIPEHSEKVVTLYYGIYTSSELRPRSNRDRLNFIAVGRLVEKKGFKYLIDACDMLKRNSFRFRCEVVGQGPLESQLKAQIAELDVADCVSLLGYVPPNQMNDFYSRGDVLVAPCVVAENGDVDGLPNVCLEAMNCGLPVISTTVSGIPESIVEGINGWLVAPNDAQALADAMIKAITADDLQSMRVASHQTVIERFDVRKNVLSIRDLMERNRMK